MAVAAPALAGLDPYYGIKDDQTFGAGLQQMADRPRVENQVIRAEDSRLIKCGIISSLSLACFQPAIPDQAERRTGSGPNADGAP